MECLVSLKKRPKFIDAIEKFQLSGAYPVFFAILCAISGLGNKYVYLPIISIFALSLLFSVLFVRDNKVFIAPIFMIYYSLGTDTPKAFFDSNGSILSAFDTDGFIGICILAAVIVIPFMIRFIVNGAFTYAFKHRGITFYGMIALNVGILLGGAFSSHWSPISLAYGLFLVGGLDIFYLVLYFIIKQSDDSIFSYVCKTLVFTSLLISVQTITVTLRAYFQGVLFFYKPWLDLWMYRREYISLSWGISTIIGSSSAVGIPAAMYLARKERFPLFYYLSAIIMWGITVIANARSSMLVGFIFLIIGIITIAFSGKNKRCNLIFTILLAVFSVLAIIFLYNRFSEQNILEKIIKKFLDILRLKSFDDRLELFGAGIKDFLSAPVFGTGWSKGAHSTSSALHQNNFYSNMYHCIVIQMVASAGVVGLLAFVFHVKDIFILAFKRIKLDRLLLLSVPVMILLMSLVDNFFFYLNLQIFYVGFLCLAEKHLEITKNKTD